MRRTGKDAFEAMKIIQSVSKDQAPNQGPRRIPGDSGGPIVPVQNQRPNYNAGGQLGRNLQELARLIKADAGIETAFAEIDGWDHHQNENNQLPNLLSQFSNAISAFCSDLWDRMDDIVIVTMSEFGRTVAENGAGGTDHGHGSLMMVIGGGVKGGKIYGEWPGLEKEQLFEGRDLAVTTDFRVVLSELVGGHLGRTDLDSVFPGFRPGKILGLLRA
jgi:uncharacterized protein (DUF1501 family)